LEEPIIIITIIIAVIIIIVESTCQWLPSSPPYYPLITPYPYYPLITPSLHREYLSVAAIIGGTCIVSMGKKSSGPASSPLGILFIALSLACDGITGGVQNRLKQKSKAASTSLK
jgi:drug/metabolite transporter (DMT)-like permease